MLFVGDNKGLSGEVGDNVLGDVVDEALGVELIGEGNDKVG